MNKRLYKKICKRINLKFENDKRMLNQKISIKEFLSILTGLEKRVWKIKEERLCRLMDELIEEMKAEGTW